MFDFMTQEGMTKDEAWHKAMEFEKYKIETPKTEKKELAYNESDLLHEAEKEYSDKDMQGRSGLVDFSDLETLDDLRPGQ